MFENDGMMSMNSTMSHAKMYSGKHSDMQMIAFLHARSNPKLLHGMDDRDIIHVVNIVPCISPRQEPSF